MATFKHISSKNADYGAAEQYLTFEHDEFTMKPTLDENGRLMLREDYRIATLNCGDEDFAVACIDMVLNKQQLSAPGGKTSEKESVLKKLEEAKAAQFQKKTEQKNHTQEL